MRRLVVLALGLLASEQALSCSCADFTLARRFQLADSVFTAVVVDEYVSHSGIAKSSLFSITESFKGFPRFSALSSSTDGALCGIDLDLGVEYLFFTDESGSIGGCSGIRATEGAGRTLHALRAFTSGATPDLSEPWHFLENEWICALGTDFEITEEASRVGQLRFRHHKAGRDTRGTSELQLIIPMSNFGTEGKLKPLQLVFADKTYAVPWNASRTHELQQRDDPIRTIRYPDGFMVDGADLREILQQIAQATSFRIQYDSEENWMDVDTEVGTTHLGNGVSEFLGCLQSN